MSQTTMYPAITNSPATTLSTGITASDTSITVADITKVPSAPNVLTIGTGETAETILYTGINASTLTGVVRGFQGAARAWSSGALLARNFTAYDHDTFRANIADIISTIATLATKSYVDSIVSNLDWQKGVKDRYDPTSALPTSPVSGDRYIATASANGWTTNHIYECTSDGTWTNAYNITPNEGYTVWVDDEDVYYRFDGSAWGIFEGLSLLTAGAGLAKTGNQLDVGAGYGIQADADSVTIKIDGNSLTKSSSGLKVAFGTTSDTVCVGNDSRLSDSRAPLSHTHGNITNAGAIGSTANLPIITTTSGVLTAGSFGTGANTFCQGNDSRLHAAASDNQNLFSHVHAYSAGTTDVTNSPHTVDGQTDHLQFLAGTNITLTMDSAGIMSIAAPAFGTVAGTICQGNDSRLSDARTPVSHVHGNITNAGAIGSTANLPVITTTSGVLTVGSFGTAANTFCQGNDSRLSDARTPANHNLIDTTKHPVSGLTTGTFIRAASATTYAFSAIQTGDLPTGIAATKIADGSVSDAEFEFLNGVTSAIQTQLNEKASIIHNLVDTTNHPASGLTTGHVLRASGTTSYAFAALQASDLPALSDITKKSISGSSTASAYLAFAQTISDNPTDFNALFRISVNSPTTTIGQTMYVFWNGQGEIVPVINVFSKTKSSVGATSGIYYLRTVYPKVLANGYKAFLELWCYDATQRDITVELIHTNGVELLGSLTASTYNSTYQANNSLAVAYNGFVSNSTLYGSLSGTASRAYNVYTSSYTAGEALLANELIFLKYDSKWYKCVTASIAIPIGSVIGAAGSAYSLNATVGATTGGTITVPSGWGTIQAGKDVYIRGTVSVAGVTFTGDGTITTEITNGYSYMRVGTAFSTSTIFLDGNNTVITVDSNGNISALDGYSLSSVITAADLPTGIDAAKLNDGTVSNTEFGYLNGVTSAIQTQLDAKASSSHAHGNITAAGAIGSTANLPIITTTSGVLTVGSFGTGANTFCQGNDSRLSDARTPAIHNLVDTTNHPVSGLTAGTFMRAASATSYAFAAIQAADLPASIDAAKIGSGTVSNTEFGYLDGVTSAIQTQLDARLSKSGGTMTGALIAQNNTNYTTGQARNIFLSTGDPTGGGNGDIWIKYTA